MGKFHIIKAFDNLFLRFFTSIEEIRATLEFPSKEAFYSELKQTAVNDDDYEDAKRLYYYRIQLRYLFYHFK